MPARSTPPPVVPMRRAMVRDRPAYRVRLLEAPRLVADGIEHGPPGARELLRWEAVAAARAAEVGEPEGVRTIVFDLIAEQADGGVAMRMDADPGADATEVARAIAAGCAGRARPSIKSLAVDGIPARWFPDLAAFEDAAAEEVG